MEWFECKVKYDKTMENGLIKQVTEAYLVDALSFTEAERRFLEEIEPFMSGEYMVTDIKRAKIAELFESNDGLADRWFKCKVAFITLDEKTGAEKRANQMMMVQAIRPTIVARVYFRKSFIRPILYTLLVNVVTKLCF